MRAKNIGFSSLTTVLSALLLALSPGLIAAELPPGLQGLGLWESPQASRELPGWTKPTRIVVRNVFGQDLAGTLGASLPGVEVVGVTSVAEAREAVVGAQALVGFCDQEIFEAADQLHWVQVYWAGVESCVSEPAMAAGGLLLSNGQRLSSTAIAEHTLALMLSLTRGLPGYHQAQQQQRWQPDFSTTPAGRGELGGATLLVVGLGGIGTQVAERAHALGMRVIATRGSRREGPDYVEYVGLADEALELSRQADIVVNAAPLTPATEAMFDAEFFAAMKPSAYFISVGRGQSTVTADLIAALRSGAIAGAGLDVIDPEPLPDNHEAWSVPGLIITPHVAAQSPESLQRIFLLVAENMRRYTAGEPLLSVVDIQRGY